MRSLGTSSYDPLDARNDYSDLNLGVSSSAARWTARGHAHSIFDHRSIGSNSMTHIRTNSFEAEDIANYDRALIGNSASSLIGGAGSNSTSGRSGLYYSPPGTSYTIVEREQRPHSPHYYYNSAGSKSRDLYLDSSINQYIFENPNDLIVIYFLL